MTLAACAAPAGKNAAGTKTASADGLSCTSERVVGSNLPQRVCTTRAQREAMADEARTRMNNMHSSGISAGAGK